MTLTTEDMSMRDKVMAVLEDALRTIKASNQIIAGFPADVRDAVEAELAEVQEIVKSMDDYVLLHKSHIETEQQYDMAKYGFLTRAMVQVYAVDVTPEIEILYSELSQDDLLGQHRDYCVGKLATYLEASKPEQTQPDPS